MKKLFALILALALCACVAMADTVEVMSHEDYNAAEIDDPVTIETYVQAHQAWWEKDGVGRMTVYCQSEDGAYLLYDMNLTEEESKLFTPGTKIRVTGFKAEWRGEIEISDAKYEILEGEEPFIAEPFDVTELLGTDELIDHQNELVLFSGMTVEPSKIEGDDTEYGFLYAWDGSGTREGNSDLYFNASINGETYTFTVESYLTNNETEVYAAVEALQVGDVIDMEGFLYWYEGANPHIVFVEHK